MEIPNYLAPEISLTKIRMHKVRMRDGNRTNEATIDISNCKVVLLQIKNLVIHRDCVYANFEDPDSEKAVTE